MGRKRKVISVEEGLQHKLLPPCRVCDGPAGGFHYGVNTCEACKGFFHRSTKSTQTYRCDTGGKCTVHFKIQKICKKCRFTKCLSVGMGKHAIKTGRYTVEKRTQDTMELKKICAPSSPFQSLDSRDNSANAYEDNVDRDSLRQQIMHKESSGNRIAQQNSSMEGVSSAVSPSQLPNGFGRSMLSPGQEETCDSFENMQETHSDYSTPAISKQSFNSIPSNSTPSTQGSLSSPETSGRICSPPMLSTTVPQQQVAVSPYALHSVPGLQSDMDSSNFHISSQPMQTNNQQGCSREELNSESQQQCISRQSLQDPSFSSHSQPSGFTDSHTETMSQSSTSVCSHCSDSNDVIYELYKDRDKVVNALLQAKAEHLEHLLPYMTEEELRTESIEHLETCRLRQEMFGQLTRLPDQEYDQIFESTGLDADGRQQRLGMLSSLLEIHIRAQAKFAKCIPGFGLLSMEDQVTLIKYSRVEVLRVIGYYNVEPKLGVILCWDGRLRCSSEIVGEMCSHDMLSAYVDLCIKYENLQLNQQEKVLLAAIVLMAPDRMRHMDCPKVQLIYELLNKCLIDLFSDRFKKPQQKFAQVVSMMIKFRTFGHTSLKSLRQLRLDKYSNVKSNPLLRDMLAGLFFDEGEDDTEEFVSQPVNDNTYAGVQSNSEHTS